MENQKSSFGDLPQFSSFEHLFLTWLFINDLYHDFTSCMRRAGYKGPLRSWLFLHFNDAHDSPATLISGAFEWVYTPQGYCFWRRASESWKCYLGRFINSLK